MAQKGQSGPTVISTKRSGDTHNYSQKTRQGRDTQLHNDQLQEGKKEILGVKHSASKNHS